MSSMDCFWLLTSAVNLGLVKSALGEQVYMLTRHLLVAFLVTDFGRT